jgi:hypothetical protein
VDFVLTRLQLTLEELDQVFSVPTSQYISYELKVWLPWFIKRYVFFQKGTPRPPPLIGAGRYAGARDELAEEKARA